MSRLSSILGNLDKAQEEEVIKVAQEAISVEREREYCMWVKPTEEGWAWLREHATTCYLDVLMPMLGGRRRVRAGADSCEMTVKVFDGADKIEENSEIGYASGLSFYADGNAAHLFRRAHLPASEELVNKGGKHWDIDVFHVYNDHPSIPDKEALLALFEQSGQGTSFGDWVKVELEVETFQLESILDYIPFAFEESMPSKPKDADSQEFLRNYWDNETRI